MGMNAFEEDALELVARKVRSRDFLNDDAHN